MSLGTANILIFKYAIEKLKSFSIAYQLFKDFLSEPHIEIIFVLLPFYMLVIGKEHHATYFNWLIQIGYS